jgi:hypothetical protein
VSLVAQHFLAGIIATRAAGFRGLNALAVDHHRNWAGLATSALAILHQQVMRDRLLYAGIRQAPNQP